MEFGEVKISSGIIEILFYGCSESKLINNIIEILGFDENLFDDMGVFIEIDDEFLF